MSEDNWKHRSDGMRCRTCMFYVEKVGSRPEEYATEAGPHDECHTTPVVVGRCRRHCPTMGGFPAVFPGDWCGDHKLDATKL